jgi:hypothetical protein
MVHVVKCIVFSLLAVTMHFFERMLPLSAFKLPAEILEHYLNLSAVNSLGDEVRSYTTEVLCGYESQI